MTPEFIILHDSASPFGNMHLINQWHDQRGFRWIHPYHGTFIHVGYHYIIGNGYPWKSREYVDMYDGLIEIARPENAVGAHCRANGRNKDSLGICFIGEPFTTKQITHGANFVKSLMEKYGILVDNVRGHKEEEPKKQDPRFSMDWFRDLLNF